jgi:8-oxo-dGTP pyrophosphatase MutT (NUDIX family)
MKRRQRVEELVSAGGVVYRDLGGGTEVVICGRKYPALWGLPKGTPESGESHEETAVREVNEETGLQVRIECRIGAIDYWFVRARDGVRCHKMVHFYLMTSHGGDTSLHDHEFDMVKWVPIQESLDTLTYQDEVRIVQKGIPLVPETL